MLKFIKNYRYFPFGESEILYLNEKSFFLRHGRFESFLSFNVSYTLPFHIEDEADGCVFIKLTSSHKDTKLKTPTFM